MSQSHNDDILLHTVSGLRTRFFPKNRIGQGLISLAPWLDMVLLLILFLLLQTHFVLQPGVLIRLPETRFSDGSRPVMALVVLSVPGGPEQAPREIAFFDDARYLLDQERYREALREALAARARTRPDGDLAILADQAVAHGTVMTLCDMARDVGIGRVNVSSREPAP